jgi:hypothetical protein
MLALTLTLKLLPHSHPGLALVQLPASFFKLSPHFGKEGWVSTLPTAIVTFSILVLIA